MHNDSCYFFNNGPGKFYRDHHFVSCGSSEPGGFAQCCQPGTYCLSDGICKFDTEPHLVDKANSLYYAGLCTDPSGKAEVCRHECFTSDTYYYIKWLGDSWQCCYGPHKGDGDCTNPKGESFHAPAPQKLTTSAFLVNPRVATSVLATAVPVPISIEGVTNSAAVKSYVTNALANGREPTWFKSMPTAVQTYFVEPTLLGLPSSSASPSHKGPSTTPPPSASNSPNGSGNDTSENDSDNLGVKVGVPVAVVVALLILAIVGYFFWRRRRIQKRRKTSKYDDDDTVMGDTSPKEQPARAGLTGSVVTAELPYSPAPVYSAAEKSSHLDQKTGNAHGTHPALTPQELDSPVRPSELADTSSIHSERAELPASTVPPK